MSSSNLVLARMIYSGSCHGAHAQYREPVPLISEGSLSLMQTVMTSQAVQRSPSYIVLYGAL